jgi:uncharacterized protein
MELTNEFHVHTSIDRAWAVLTDIELIAPCMPGAALEEIEGDEYRGGVKIKVGPITAQYKGKATFLERDAVNHKAVLRAEGRDTKGQGNANATITAQLTQSGTGTDVKVTTDLTVTGRVAQFGRGVLADVSAKLLGQFVQCLEHNVLTQPETVIAEVASAGAADAASSAVSATASAATVSATGTTSSPAPVATSVDSPESASVTEPTEPPKPAVRKIQYEPTKPVDLLDAAGSPVLKRAAPAAAVLLVLLWLARRWRR